MVLDAFYHIKMKIIFKILKNDFWPPLPGVWKFPKTHYRPKNENHCMGVFGLSFILWFWHLFLASWHFWHFGHFGIMRPKSRHHERAKMPKPRHLWSLMMSTFESQDAKIPKMSKMPRCQNWETKDAKATLVTHDFGSIDAKMAL